MDERQGRFSNEILAALQGVKYKTFGNCPHGPSLIEIIQSCSERSKTVLENIGKWITYNPNYLNDPTVAKAAIWMGYPETLQYLLENGLKLPDNAFIDASSSSKSTQKLMILLKFGFGKDSEINAQALIATMKKISYRTTADEKKIQLKDIKLLLDLPINWTIYSHEIIISSLNFPEGLRQILYTNNAIISPKILPFLVHKIEALPNDIIIDLIHAGAGNDADMNASILSTMLEATKLSPKQQAFLDLFLKIVQLNWRYMGSNGIPLIHMAWPTHHSLIPIFCAIGADINVIDNDGATLFHKIVLDKQGEAHQNRLFGLNILQACSASPVIHLPKNSRKFPNATPYQLAVLTQQHTVAQWISEYTNDYSSKHALDTSDTISAQDKALEDGFKQRNPLSNHELELLAFLKEERAQLQLQHETIQQNLKKKDLEIANILGQQPVLADQYDPQDLTEIKAMIIFYVEHLAKFPQQASELLRKSAVPTKKSKEDIQAIIKTAFVGSHLAKETEPLLLQELLEINHYASIEKSQLHLKSKLNYRPADIAKMVHDGALGLILEAQEDLKQQAVEAALNHYKKTLEDQNQSNKKHCLDPDNFFFLKKIGNTTNRTPIDSFKSNPYI